MKTFEEWCNEREIVLNELSPKFLTMAYKIWGEECFVEGQRYEVENAALRKRLEKAYEFPVKYGDKIWVLDGKHLFDRYVWAIEIKSNGVFLSLSEKTMWYDRGIVSLSERGKTWFLDSEKELAKARMKELKGE